MTPTTLLVLRHGVTASTEQKLFCGRGGADPSLTATGHDQAARAAGWIARRHHVDAVIASPLRRARQTADHVAASTGTGTGTGTEIELDADLAETSFGEWDGHTFADISDRWPRELRTWLDSTAVEPPGGEAFDAVAERVEAARRRLLARHEGRTVVVVTHVTPIKMLVRAVLGAPMSAIHAMEIAPASLTTIQFWPDGIGSLQGLSVVP